MKIKVKNLKVALGHQKPSFRTGKHSDKRTRRNNTRSAQQRKACES